MLTIALHDNSSYAIAHHCYGVRTSPYLLENCFFSHLQFVVAIPGFIYILWSRFFKSIHVLGQAHMISYLCVCFVQNICVGL